jgi:hypothetical protein
MSGKDQGIANDARAVAREFALELFIGDRFVLVPIHFQEMSGELNPVLPASSGGKRPPARGLCRASWHRNSNPALQRLKVQSLQPGCKRNVLRLRGLAQGCQGLLPGISQAEIRRGLIIGVADVRLLRPAGIISSDARVIWLACLQRATRVSASSLGAQSEAIVRARRFARLLPVISISPR